MVGTKIIRVTNDFVKALDGVARKNEINRVQASQEVSRLIRQNQNSKVLREIKF